MKPARSGPFVSGYSFYILLVRAQGVKKKYFESDLDVTLPLVAPAQKSQFVLESTLDVGALIFYLSA